MGSDFPNGPQLMAMTQVMASLSIVALSSAIGVLLYLHGWRKEKLAFHAHLTLVLLILDLLDCFLMVASRHTYGIEWACQMQGMGLTIVELCVILWNAFMAYNLHAWLVAKADVAVLQKRLNRVLFCFVVYSVCNAVLFRLFYSRYGPADLWCWFPASHKLGRIYALHGYLYPATLYIIAVVLNVYCKILRVQQGNVSTRQTVLRRRVTVRLIGYLLAFLGTWCFAIINRLVQMFYDKRVPWLLTLHVLAKPSMGLLDSLVYGSVWSVCKRETFLRRRRRGGGHQPSQLTLQLPGHSQADDSTSASEPPRGDTPKNREEEEKKWAELMSRLEEGQGEEGEEGRVIPPEGVASSRRSSCNGSALHASSNGALLTDCAGSKGAAVEGEGLQEGSRLATGGHVPRVDSWIEPRVASIFVSTYNYAHLYPGKTDTSLEAEGALEAWIPRGHDLYIIGLQEVCGLSSFRSLLHAHLGGPQAYTMFSQEITTVLAAGGIGPGIALTVFGRREEVESGVLEMTAGSVKDGQQVLQGLNLGLFRAGNKGGVGLPFRYHGSSLAVITAHLPADGSRRSNVVKRDKAVRELFSQARLSGEPFDLQLQYHHVIFLGDLNYRLSDVTPSEALRLIADAARATPDPFPPPTASDEKSEESEGEPPPPGNKGPGPPKKPLTWLQRRYARTMSASADGPPSPSPSSPSLPPSDNKDNNAWATLLEEGKDELRVGMASGSVLHRFVEPPIAFPPSYRRERHRDCGDYTDEAVLAQAYSTHLHSSGRKRRSRTTKSEAPDPLIPPPPPTAPTPASLPRPCPTGSRHMEDKVSDTFDCPAPPRLQAPTVEESSCADSEDEEEDEEEEPVSCTDESSDMRGMDLDTSVGTDCLLSSTLVAKVVKPPGVKIRVPSYTDRILLHSLPDMVGQLQCRAYDLCDSLWASDHRPISAVLHLDLATSGRMHRRYSRAFAAPLVALSQGTNLREDKRLALPLPLPLLLPSHPPLDLPPTDPLALEGSDVPPSTFIITIRVSNLRIQLLPPAPPPIPSAPPHPSSSSDARMLVHSKPSPASSAVEEHVSGSTEPLSRPRSESPEGSESTHGHHSQGPARPPSLLLHSSSSTFLGGGSTGSSQVQQQPPRNRTYTSTGHGKSTLFEPARVILAFPLPCENDMRRAERELELLHVELGHAWGTWGRGTQSLLQNMAGFDYDVAMRESMTLDAAVRVRGALHALVKLVDDSGQDIAQGVLSLPRPGQRPLQLNDVALTLGTSYRGTLSATVEIVKVKIKANVR